MNYYCRGKLKIKQLIKNKIIWIRSETNVSPSKADIELGAKFLSPTLKLLIKVLVGHGSKQASLGQCISKAMKANSVSFVIRV